MIAMEGCVCWYGNVCTKEGQMKDVIGGYNGGV